MSSAKKGGPVRPSTSVWRPLGVDEIRITGGLWGQKQRLNADAILQHCESWMERIGWIGNFDRAAADMITGSHAGIEFVDSEVYKLLEAMAWELGREPSDILARRYQVLVERVAAAQQPDGYLHTSFGRSGQPPRYSNLEAGHELYCFGHLLQAAVARLRTGHDDVLPQVARRLADHVDRQFGPDGRVGVCGHPEIEMALVEFARATGEKRYLELARLFIERRGTGTLAVHPFGQEYFQDDLPVRQATTMRGHAVRALYLAAGALDVATETGDGELAAAVQRQWANGVAHRTYITGGVGSHHQDEAFGDDFELPADRAYAETCAGIASVMLSWRLLLSTGEDRYADLIERTLLNNVLASPRADGRAFYYTNTLHQRTPGLVPDERQLESSRGVGPARALVRGLVLSHQRRPHARQREPLLRDRQRRRPPAAPVRGLPGVHRAGRRTRHRPGVKRLPGRRHGLGAHRRGARSGDHPPAAGSGLGVRHRQGERRTDRSDLVPRRDPPRVSRRGLRPGHVSCRRARHPPRPAHRLRPGRVRG